MANNIEKQLKEISERLEQGVKEIFTSERYTEYLNNPCPSSIITVLITPF